MADFAGGESQVGSVDTGASSQVSAPSSTGSQVSSPTISTQAAAPSATPQFTPDRNQQGQFQSQQPQTAGQFSGQSAGVLAALKASGYDTGGFSDDRSFLTALDGRLTEAETYKQQVADYQRQLAARGQPIPGQFERVEQHLAQPVEAKPGWAPPQYDSRNDAHFQYDEQTKRWVPNKPNVPYELVQAKNDYMEYRAAFAKEFAENPVDTLWSRTEDRNRNLIREELKGLFDQMRVTKDTNDWLEKHKTLLFTDGQIDHTGDPAKLTYAGQLAMQAADDLDAKGISDPAYRRELTEKYIATELARQHITQQQDPANRTYTLAEIQQAVAAVQGMNSQQWAAQQQQMQPAQQPAPQFVPQQQPMPQGAFQPQPQYQQPPQQYQPVPPQFQQPQYPGYPPQQMQPQFAPQMSPEQINAEQKRAFLGGVAHSPGVGAPNAANPGEFVPQPSPNGRPNFLGIANQIAASRGLNL